MKFFIEHLFDKRDKSTNNLKDTRDFFDKQIKDMKENFGDDYEDEETDRDISLMDKYDSFEVNDYKITRIESPRQAAKLFQDQN